MKTVFTMSDAKKEESSETPVVIAQMSPPETKRSKTKKYLIIGGSVILGMAIILTAILVGMYIFTKAQNELIKYTLNVNKDTKTDMITDKDENTIEYHVQNEDGELWVFDDFNRDIQTMKMKTKTGFKCYILPLNRTSRTVPSKVRSDVEYTTRNETDGLTYKIADTPVSDVSFLGRKVKEACNGLPVHWMYPSCDNGEPNTDHRQKRACYRVYKYQYSYYCGGGCCICHHYQYVGTVC